jgi:hypothetical protein
MRFNSKSVLLNDGVKITAVVKLPEIFDSLEFPKCIWTTAIKEFNNVLNERVTVTEEVLGKPIDILQLEQSEDIALAIVVRREDVEAFEDVWFKLKGKVDFNLESHPKLEVESIRITDLTYTDASGNVRGVLNKS